MDFPSKLGEAIDLLYKLRAERLEAQGKVDEMKAKESALHDHILNSFEKSELEGGKGEVASASVKRTTTMRITDWEAFYKYVAENGAFDLLQRRGNDAAFRARLEDNLTVPGTEPFQVVSLSLTKAGRS